MMIKEILTAFNHIVDGVKVVGKKLKNWRFRRDVEKIDDIIDRRNADALRKRLHKLKEKAKRKQRKIT